VDIKTLLKSLLDHKVKFIIVGAWALPAYGYERMTRDVDIFIESTEENAKRCIKALERIGFHAILELSVDELLKNKVLLREYILSVDIHPFITGVDFVEVWKNKTITEVKGLKVYVPSLDDLITMKEAAGREKDKLDLQVLRKIKEKTENK
jgi:predicted nucleotidyltransferase